MPRQPGLRRCADSKLDLGRFPGSMVDLWQAIGMLHAAKHLGPEIQKAMPLNLWT